MFKTETCTRKLRATSSRSAMVRYGLSLSLSVYLLTFVISAGADAPVEKALFTAVPTAGVDLDAKQALILDRIKHCPATVASHVVRLNPDAAADTTAAAVLSMPLPSNRAAKFAAKWSRGTKDAWIGVAKGDVPGQGMVISKTDRDTVGLIYSGDTVYSVEPLGKGLQVISQLDQRKFKDDHPQAFKKIEKAATPKSDPGPAATANAPVTIRVLVAYTPKVESLQASMQALISGAVDIANTSYQNSNINIRLALAYSGLFNYTESGTHEADLDKFRTDSGIAQLRQANTADVCVLLIDNDQFCGLAAAILAEKDTAFAVVHHGCAVGNISFAHEIGHLMGARHNLEVDPTIDPSYPWNHGFLSSQNWRSIMAYPTAAQPIRVPYWSNPDVKYGTPPIPTGTTDKQNNALMLNTSANKISQFHK